ncbi:MAG: hypothetical protein N2114_02615, partial [Candidatus Goldbacteria bacterium]|nr:hypothetical protein [Candidatus Goldiibacteriota bacterium]
MFITILLLYYNPKSNLNRLAALLIACFGIWSFVKVFSHNVNTPEKVVLFLENFFSFSWILIPAFAFYFFALQTKKDYLI